MTLIPDTAPTVNTADNKWWEKRHVKYMRELDSHHSTDTKTQGDIKTDGITLFSSLNSFRRKPRNLAPG
jgi:hypothetical protein